jgi:hypothetical protein
MKTYAETQELQPFDWNSFLDRAIAGNLDQGEWTDARARSAMWPTCACGNQCESIPRQPGSGAPYDGRLRFLGAAFATDIRQGEFRKAKETLKAIEGRACEILEAMSPEKTKPRKRKKA